MVKVPNHPATEAQQRRAATPGMAPEDCPDTTVWARVAPDVFIEVGFRVFAQLDEGRVRLLCEGQTLDPTPESETSALARCIRARVLYEGTVRSIRAGTAEIHLGAVT